MDRVTIDGNVLMDRVPIDDSRAIEVVVEGGFSFIFLGFELPPDSDDVTHFPQPSDYHPAASASPHPLSLISARYEFFDIINPDDQTCDLIRSRDDIFKSDQLSGMFAAYFLCFLGHGVSIRQLKQCVDQFFSAIAENPNSDSKSNSKSTRYFHFSTWRKGWRQSPYFVPEEEGEEEYVSEEGDKCVRVLKSRPCQQSIIVSDSSTTDCAICLNQLKVGSAATRLSCSHSFHGYCIVQWLIRSRSCPLCRFSIPTTYS